MSILATKLDLHKRWLSGQYGGVQADLRGTNMSDANLRGANLSRVVGVLRASCSWTDHGEAGRELLVVLIGDEPKYFCGCFVGSATELADYIRDRDASLRASRQIAFDFCSQRMAEMIEQRGAGGAR